MNKGTGNIHDSVLGDDPRAIPQESINGLRPGHKRGLPQPLQDVRAKDAASVAATRTGGCLLFWQYAFGEVLDSYSGYNKCSKGCDGEKEK